MAWENRRYTIFNVSETGSLDWDSVLDNPAICKTNKTGSFVMVKWDGNMPSAVKSLTTRVSSSADKDGNIVAGSGESGSFTWSEFQRVLDIPGVWTSHVISGSEG
jgi:hypothetical protein